MANYIMIKETLKQFSFDYRDAVNKYYVQIKEVSLQDIPVQKSTIIAKTISEETNFKFIFGADIECIDAVDILEYDIVWLITNDECSEKVFKIVFLNS